MTLILNDKECLAALPGDTRFSLTPGIESRPGARPGHKLWRLSLHRAAGAALGGQWLLIMGLQRFCGFCPLRVGGPRELPGPPGVCAPGWSRWCWTLPMSPGLDWPPLPHGSVS